MATTTWNPTGYLTFGAERLRPAADLLARVPLATPRHIADLGCGPGNATGLLARRWPGAALLGVDSSPEMLARARQSGAAADWQQADLTQWAPERPFDLLFANAVFQWLGRHEALFPRLMGFLRPDGALAVQMPRSSLHHRTGCCARRRPRGPGPAACRAFCVRIRSPRRMPISIC